MADISAALKMVEDQAFKPLPTEAKVDTSVPTPNVVTEDKESDEKPIVNAEAKKDTPTAETPTTTPTQEIDEEAIALKFYNKKNGTDFKSFDEITATKKELTEEEKKIQEEKEYGEAIEYGKANKKFTQTDYDNFVKFSAKDPSGVIKEALVSELQKENKIDKEEAEALFAELYHTDADPDSLRYKRGQALIQKQYDDMKNSQYGNILSVKDSYKAHKELVQKANVYESQLDKEFKNLQKDLVFEIGEDKINFPIDLSKEEVKKAIAEIRSGYNNRAMMDALMPDGKFNEQVFRDAISEDIQRKFFKEILSTVHASALSKATLQQAKGRAGVLSPEELRKGTGVVSKENKKTNVAENMLAEAFPGFAQKATSLN